MRHRANINAASSITNNSTLSSGKDVGSVETIPASCAAHPRRQRRTERTHQADLGTTESALGAWTVFADEAGFLMTPHTARTYVTLVIRLNDGSRHHLLVAVLCCYKPGDRPRMVFRHTGD
ncbi:hypothetical protein [Streptomyces sp. NPDC048489]|uniref:hypothetical protein n=1 Tax=Streptomyces sp. NPDC048489 TaxID=3154504 RepID=UPI00343BBB00